jgi:hypothetical protein
VARLDPDRPPVADWPTPRDVVEQAAIRRERDDEARRDALELELLESIDAEEARWSARMRSSASHWTAGEHWGPT